MAAEPKFKVGQIVVMKGKRQLPFRVLFIESHDGEFFYGWNKRNAAHEAMVRALTDDEIAAPR